MRFVDRASIPARPSASSSGPMAVFTKQIVHVFGSFRVEFSSEIRAGRTTVVVESTITV